MTLLQIIMGAALIGVIALFASTVSKNGVKLKSESNENNVVVGGVIGLVNGALDTLGCNFEGTSISIVKFSNMMRDKNIPGTIVISSVTVLALEFFIFTSYLGCDMLTLLLLLLASAVGAVLGSKFMVQAPRSLSCTLMGVGLVITAIISFMKASYLGPFDNDGYYFGLSGGLLILAAILFVLVGALGSWGVSVYPLAMGMLMIFGCSMVDCFPIVMGSAAISRIAGSYHYIKEKNFDFYTVLGMSAGGILGVVFAWKVVTSFPSYAFSKIFALVSIAGAVLFFTSSSKEEKFVPKAKLQPQPQQPIQTNVYVNPQAVNTVATPTNGGGNIEDKFKDLEDLKKLCDMGIITQEEFDKKKKEILSKIY